MISVEEAVARIAGAFRTLEPERVAIAQAPGRVLAEDVVAKSDQPPAEMSAMDGYAVRSRDAQAGAVLAVIGEAPAGRVFPGRVGAGEAVRIFTGGVVPEGADTVVIQETTRPEGDRIRITETSHVRENTRAQGLDFRAGDILLPRGHRIGARDLALAAAGDAPDILVTRKPRIGIVATGDELSRPGTAREPGGIVASSLYALQAMAAHWGGDGIDLGILPDRPEAFAALPRAARGLDLIVTQGGASVGDHDLVRSALAPHGFVLDFWRIAMRPGKPLIFGRLNETPLLGLPGNPVSAMVCAILFLAPAIATMLGMPYAAPLAQARLGAPLWPAGKRQDYIRARLSRRDGMLLAEPFALQDSSMQKVFAQSDALIVRPPYAPAANAGDLAEVLLLQDV